MSRTKGALNKHKKEKPIKEKKKRGRKPGSTKQKQEQHQVVNVNINSSGHKSSEEKKKKKREKKQVQNAVPNIIFNPSINTPSYGFPTNKAETNPPYYDTNSLMQPIQNKPLKPVDVKPEVIETVPSAVPISIPKQPPPLPSEIPTGIPTGIPINSKTEEKIKPVDIKPQASAPPSYESYETPTDEQKKEHDEKFKEIFAKLKNREDEEGLGKKIPFQKVLTSTALAALGGAGTGGLSAFVAGTPILEGAYSGAMISTLANLGNEIGGEKGAAIGGSIGGGIVARTQYNRYKKKEQQAPANENPQQQDFDNFL